jgi:hypothetical protein
MSLIAVATVRSVRAIRSFCGDLLVVRTAVSEPMQADRR